MTLNRSYITVFHDGSITAIANAKVIGTADLDGIDPNFPYPPNKVSRVEINPTSTFNGEGSIGIHIVRANQFTPLPNNETVNLWPLAGLTIAIGYR